MPCSEQEVLLDQGFLKTGLDYILSHRGVSSTGLTGRGGAGDSQALLPGWVNEE